MILYYNSHIGCNRGDEFQWAPGFDFIMSLNEFANCVCLYLSKFLFLEKPEKVTENSWLMVQVSVHLSSGCDIIPFCIYIYTLLHSHKAINIPFWIPYIIPFCMLLYTELGYLWISSVCELTAIIPAIWLSYPLLICIMIRYILYI